MEGTTAISAVKEEVKLRDWEDQIAAQQASGMTLQRWCKENDQPQDLLLSPLENP